MTLHLMQVKAALSQLTHNISENAQQQCCHYLNQLLIWNKAYNLTAITAIDEVLTKHLLDSLSVAPFIADAKQVIDLGSGAGLPGLLLAIVSPDIHFTLLDSSGKRTRFMQQMVLELALKNVTIVQSRVQDYQTTQRFDYILSRAFASLSEMFEWSQHLMTTQTTYLAMKGKYAPEMLTELLLHCDCEVIFLEVPGLNEERHLVRMKAKQSVNEDNFDDIK